MNSNSVVKSITNAFTEDLTPLPELTESIIPGTGTSIYGSTSSSASSWFTFSWQTIIIIILILALLGFNIFIYLAKGTSDVASGVRSIFGPILSFFGLATVNVANQAIQGAAQGTAAVAESVADVSQSATNAVKGADAKMGAIDGMPVQQQMQQQTLNREDALQHALSDASHNISQQTQYDSDIMPSDATSSIQGSTGKAGWCYIGEESGVRTCAKVGVNDTCMSGDVFPSQDICVNPNLRP
jgi:hypothetical protein